MITQERTTKGITYLQRKTMRRIPLCLLQEAYDRLMVGWRERSVCAFLGVDSELFNEVLRPAIAEA